MQPVDCGTCKARVEVRKASWQQTSVQWDEDSIAACVERRATTPRPGPNGTTFRGCSALGATVREKAVRGEIVVVDG